MATYTVKSLVAARSKRDSSKGKLMAFSTNLPPTKAGSKNSNGPKGGSAKSRATVPNNSRKGETKLSKPSIATTKVKQAGMFIKYPLGNASISATPGVSNIKNNAGGSWRSSRINHSTLRRMK
jgi:hypothetical protein